MKRNFVLYQFFSRKDHDGKMKRNICRKICPGACFMNNFDSAETRRPAGTYLQAICSNYGNCEYEARPRLEQDLGAPVLPASALGSTKSLWALGHQGTKFSSPP